VCERGHSRASFLNGLTAAAAAAVVVPQAALAARAASPARELWLHNALTGETIRQPFTIDGRTIYRPGYYAICSILRDVHVPAAQGDVAIDIRTIEALYETQAVLRLAGISAPIEVLSGYRTAYTNAQVEGARYSYHMRAQAVDFAIPGVPLPYVWRVCNSRPITGGLGYYADSHLHLDSGPRRYWTG